MGKTWYLWYLFVRARCRVFETLLHLQIAYYTYTCCTRARKTNHALVSIPHPYISAVQISDSKPVERDDHGRSTIASAHALSRVTVLVQYFEDFLCHAMHPFFVEGKSGQANAGPAGPLPPAVTKPTTKK